MSNRAYAVRRRRAMLWLLQQALLLQRSIPEAQPDHLLIIPRSDEYIYGD